MNKPHPPALGKLVEAVAGVSVGNGVAGPGKGSVESLTLASGDAVEVGGNVGGDVAGGVAVEVEGCAAAEVALATAGGVRVGLALGAEVEIRVRV